MVTSGEMCCKFTAQELCVGSCNNNMHLFPQKAVHKQIPFRDILNLIYKKIIEISVYLVQNFKNII